MATYSNRIKELRTMRDMSQQALGDLLGVNKVTVSQYERGVRKPDINVVAALCDIFNVSSDYLLGKDDVTIRLVDKEGLSRLDAHNTRITSGRIFINHTWRSWGCRTCRTMAGTLARP